MKILKGILFGILGIIAIALIAGLFIKKEFSVEKSVTIEQPVEEVFSYVKMLKNQNKFSVWMQMDPNMKKTYMGMDGTVGAVTAWDSQNSDVGKGEQEIIGIEENKRIDYELRFYKPFEATDKAYMLTERISPNKTKVIWGFNSIADYPMNLVMKLMGMEEMLGNQLQEGLNTLKDQMED
ncbi:SRPBCC family protein [Echinicola marina]|uniref:SRPBCC family protein n=1 Tax=Echinicola marina TaxID=2859768 RepID=UPI001CF65F35|nr:SRPBCC family protein [Echinicola marina]UCS92684.1 SRPBCC family protein [Echinicola marina]